MGKPHAHREDEAKLLFNSYIFILLFFPLCMFGYFALNRLRDQRVAMVFLLGMSLWFYGYFNPWYLPIMIFSIAGNYLAVKLMDKCSQALRKVILLAALLGNLSVLFYYKYFDFFLENMNALAGTDFALRGIVLPLGISFFTFQQMSYVIDACRGEVRQYNLLHYSCFVSYFPQLVAGPIVTHDELIPQFLDQNKKCFSWEQFSPGLFLFSMGLGKKVLIADLFGRAANWGFGNISQLDTTNALLAILAYTIQVYFDFSGYCDMAIGLGRMMNLELPVNFDSPYKACTITEFWDRWHKTLTRFFTRYIYIPLGGNRKGALRTYLHVMIVFLVSGIWHGANWTFILWGCLHGVFSVMTRAAKPLVEKLPRWFNWMVTFAFLNLTWVFFRADSISDGMLMLQRLFSGEFGPISSGIQEVFNVVEVTTTAQWLFDIDIMSMCPNVMTVLIYTMTMALVLFAPNAHEKMQNLRYSFLELAATVGVLVWSIMSLEGVSTFLYFNF